MHRFDSAVTRTPAEAVRGLWAVLNDRDYDAIGEWVTDDCVYYDVPLGPAFAARASAWKWGASGRLGR